MMKGPLTNKTVTRADILKRIESELDSADQWRDFNHGIEYPGSFMSHFHGARALIELLEIDDCGSVGGFDLLRGQPDRSTRTLRARFNWLRSLK